MNDQLWHAYPDRNYPPQFGAKVASIMEELQKLKTPVPTAFPEPLAAATVFESIDFSDLWTEARMVEVCHYLRGNNGLQIPQEWRKLLPTHL